MNKLSRSGMRTFSIAILLRFRLRRQNRSDKNRKGPQNLATARCLLLSRLIRFAYWDKAEKIFDRRKVESNFKALRLLRQSALKLIPAKSTPISAHRGTKSATNLRWEAHKASPIKTKISPGDRQNLRLLRQSFAEIARSPQNLDWGLKVVTWLRRCRKSRMNRGSPEIEKELGKNSKKSEQTNRKRVA